MSLNFLVSLDKDRLKLDRNSVSIRETLDKSDRFWSVRSVSGHENSYRSRGGVIVAARSEHDGQDGEEESMHGKSYC